MRLEALEAVPYSLPFREPYVTARGAAARARAGAGAGARRGARGPGRDGVAVAAGRRRACERSPRRSSGSAGRRSAESGFEPGRIWSALARCRNRGAGAQAMAAVDIALHDLAGKATGQPVWRLLGREPGAARSSATRPCRPPTRRSCERSPSAGAEAGFDTFKLKAGLAGDVAQVATVREVRRARRRSSASTPTAPGRSRVAIERLRAMAQHTLELAEQPVARPRADGRGAPGERGPHRRRRGHRHAPATRAGPYELRRLQLANVKLAKVGGIAAALEIAAEIPAYLSSALEGPVGIAAAAHTAQALPLRGTAAEPAHGLATERLFSESIGAGLTSRGRPAAARRRARPGRRAGRRRACGPPARLIYRFERWTRPTATPRSPRPWSRSWPAAACAAPSSPPARARPRWRWRCGASPRSRSRWSWTSAAPASSRWERRSRPGPRRWRSAPRARPPPTCTPPWSRPTRRRCR